MDAERRLTDAGLRRGRLHLEHSDAPKDSIYQQEPTANAYVKPGTRVDFWLSTGPRRMVTVPSLVGMKPWQASLALAIQELTLREEKVSSKIERGKIARQDPQAGARILQGSDVVVYVSIGPGD